MLLTTNHFRSGSAWRSPSWWLPRLLFVSVVLLQLYFIHRGYDDPHKHFAFQPFNESDKWKAKIVRVTADGQRISVRKPWFGYRWSSLVRERGLGRPWGWARANSGAASTLVFLQEALDWVAANTPRDDETLYYAASVTYYHNRRGPFRQRMRSQPRRLALSPGRRGEAQPQAQESSKR